MHLRINLFLVNCLPIVSRVYFPANVLSGTWLALALALAL